MGKDYYSELGVTADAPFQEIAAAFRKLAITYHPLRNTDKWPKQTTVFAKSAKPTKSFQIVRIQILFLIL